MAGKRLHIKKGRRLWLLLLLAVVLCPLLRTAEARTTAPETPPGKDTAPPAPTDTVNIDTEGTVPDAPEEQSPDMALQPEEPLWTPVAESAPVTDDYFDDVAFVGDSRTDGFRLYSGLERGTYFHVTGETVSSAVEQQNWKTDSGRKISLADAVASSGCGKIYLMLGVNELGWKGTDIFRGHAENLIRRLKADHPDAELVIQSLLPVSTEQDAKGSYVNNQRILAYNQVWRELAEENGCAYVDVAEALTGEDGCLPEELSFDGVHLNRAGCRLWLDYLRTHSVAEEAPKEPVPAQTEPEEAGPAPAPTESEWP